MKFKNNIVQIANILICILLFSGAGCKKFVEVDPPVTMVTGNNVFTSDATAIAVLNGVYTSIGNKTYLSLGFPNISLIGGLSSDELTLWSGVPGSGALVSYYTNNLSVNTAGAEVWNDCYPYIFICNSSIEALDKSNTLTPAVKQQLLGEAKFLRALFYFYLTNLYGDVPLVTSTDYTANSTISRSPVADVYKQIITDLSEAQKQLNNNYLEGDAVTSKSTTERVRPNQGAATALLARAYLFSGDYQNAEIQSSALISNSAVYTLSSLNNVFVKASLGNKEAIWQLQPVTNGSITNTQDGTLFNIPSTGPSNPANPVFLSNTLLGSFESGDQRKANGNWLNSVTTGGTTYFFPYKYKVVGNSPSVTEYTMILRLGEQYLIRAESRARQNNLAGALNDLNTIRVRASLPPISLSAQSAIIASILHERQVELFTEWGARWLDLKRTATVDATMTIVTSNKGNTWNTNQQLYPIPTFDLQKNSKLTQNPGY